MGKKLLLLFFILSSVFSVAQEAPVHRVVFLWDVTNSMHGGFLGRNNKDVIVANRPMSITKYNCDYDIYDQILETLVGKIREYRDEDEIIIVPFNDRVLTGDVWRERGTAEGKRRLEARIRGFYNADQTYTNLYDPFEYANSLFDGSKYPMAKEESMLFVLTDGVHNNPNPSRKQFLQMLESWCDVAQKYNVKGYYFMLTDQAIKDKELQKILQSSECIQPYRWFETHFYTIEGNRMITVMQGEYDRPVRMSVIPVDINKPIYGQERVRIYAEPNDFFTLDEVVTIDAGTTEIEVTPVYKYPLYDLQQKFPKESNQKITIQYRQEDQPRAEGQIKNELETRECQWEFVNKAQKTLTIKIKR